MFGIKLPDFLRPYAGKLIGGALTVGLTYVAHAVPFISGLISPNAVDIATGTIVTWLFATSFTTATNATINPTNAATGELAKSVPQAVVPKDQGPVNIGPTYAPKAGDKI